MPSYTPYHPLSIVHASPKMKNGIQAKVGGCDMDGSKRSLYVMNSAEMKQFDGSEYKNLLQAATSELEMWNGNGKEALDRVAKSVELLNRVSTCFDSNEDSGRMRYVPGLPRQIFEEKRRTLRAGEALWSVFLSFLFISILTTPDLPGWPRESRNWYNSDAVEADGGQKKKQYIRRPTDKRDT
ncbi:hypothetical protein BDP27DRAFT_1408274 [Rhodocollybia butyracea]|uniref:Uncharacterized protein n=1 Tax=Rhodocollybia butyracea TaxID=206335 RepID=A0A9P5PAA8_9AGAR|nr:hypothetical protein BDP27DRAFT_1408274 [Rhodocollybia butyracea]